MTSNPPPPPSHLLLNFNRHGINSTNNTVVCVPLPRTCCVRPGNGFRDGPGDYAVWACISFQDDDVLCPQFRLCACGPLDIPAGAQCTTIQIP
jgi:hypothetical protein